MDTPLLLEDTSAQDADPEPQIAQETSVPAERRVLTFHKPLVHSSSGPLTLQQAQVMRIFTDSVWGMFRDGAPQYRGTGYVPKLDPDLFSCLVDLGNSGAFSVIKQVRADILGLAERNDFSSYTFQHVSALVESMMTDLHSRVDYIYMKELRNKLEKGIPVDGVTLEPVRYVDDEDEARILATHATSLMDESGGDKGNVLPLRRSA